MSPHRLDHIGRRIQAKLDAASKRFKSKTTWRLLAASPRRYWDRRFILRAKGPAYYDEVEAAFTKVVHDKVIDRAMSKRSMAVDIAVDDPNGGRGRHARRLHLTAGIAGDYARCVDDLLDKLLEWTQRYGRDGELGQDVAHASRIIEITVFIGARR